MKVMKNREDNKIKNQVKYQYLLIKVASEKKKEKKIEGRNLSRKRNI